MSNIETNENLRALVKWICSFPVLSKQLKKHQIDADDNPLLLSEWLDKKDVSFAILQVAAEIVQNSSKSNEEGSKSSHATAQGDASIRKESYFASGGDIWKKLSDLMETTYSDDKLQILSSMLRMAVAENCIMREAYIGRILEINQSDVQRNLMIIIEGSIDKDDNTLNSDEESIDIQSDEESTHRSEMSSPHPINSMNSMTCFAMDLWGGKSKDNDDNKNKLEISNNQDDYSLSSSGSESSVSLNRNSPFHHKMAKVRTRNEAFGNDVTSLDGSNSPNRKRISLKPSFFNDPHQTQRNNILLDQIKALRNDNEALKQQVVNAEQAEVERTENEMKRRAEDIKKESQAIKRESIMREKYEAELKELKKRLEKETDHNGQLAEAKEKLSELQDEIDVLQHCKQKLSTSEDQLHKCRLKLEEFSDLKEALIKEEEAHSKAVERCLELENNLTTLQRLQKQVESYRVRSTEAEFKLAECEDQLAKMSTTNKDIMKKNKILEDLSHFESSEKEEMKQILLNQSATNNDFGEASGLGEGVSELNPTLKEELLRLRNDNEQLKMYKSKTSNETVLDLENKLEDTSRLATTFKERYLETKSKLEKEETMHCESRSREEGLKQDLIVLDHRIEELEKELSNERERAILAKEEAEKLLEETIKNLTEKARAEFDKMVQTMIDKLSVQEKTFDEKEKNLKDCLAAETLSFENEMKSLREGFEATIEGNRLKSEKLIKETKDNCETKIDQVKEDAEAERKKLVDKGTEVYTKKKEIQTVKMMKLKELLEGSKAEFKRYREIASTEREEFETQAREKINKITNRYQTLSRKQREQEKEIEELQSGKRKLEREKMEIREENERFRRHVGSRLGSEKNWESQFDSLQSEYNQILKENRALKNRSNVEHKNIERHHNMNFSINEDKENMLNGTNSRAFKANDYMLSKMREEYSLKFHKMNDEKRELVMRNSAAISDLQKANQRAWKLEDALSNVKTELTSTKLALQRFEHSQRIEDMEPRNRRSFFVNNRPGEDLASLAVASGNVSILEDSNLNLASETDFNNIDHSVSRDETSNSSFSSSKISGLYGNRTEGAREILNNSTRRTQDLLISVQNTPSASTTRSHKTKSSQKEIPSIVTQTQIGGNSSIEGKPECAQS